jgi:hypothetical protein
VYTNSPTVECRGRTSFAGGPLAAAAAAEAAAAVAAAPAASAFTCKETAIPATERRSTPAVAPTATPIMRLDGRLPAEDCPSAGPFAAGADTLLLLSCPPLGIAVEDADSVAAAAPDATEEGEGEGEEEGEGVVPGAKGGPEVDAVGVHEGVRVCDEKLPIEGDAETLVVAVPVAVPVDVAVAVAVAVRDGEGWTMRGREYPEMLVPLKVMAAMPVALMAALPLLTSRAPTSRNRQRSADVRTEHWMPEAGMSCVALAYKKHVRDDDDQRPRVP